MHYFDHDIRFWEKRQFFRRKSPKIVIITSTPGPSRQSLSQPNYLGSRNKVYMGESRVKPKKNQLDRMFEKIMHSTGHDQM
jgi:hypothetical protein